MELTWTTEKNEKETIKLFMRRRGFLRELHSVMVIGALWGGGLLVASSGAFGLVLLIFCLGYIALDWILIYAPRRFYRRRETNKVEYWLTDDALAFAVGETQFSSPWNRVAKKFRVDKKAIYLYGKNVPFEAQCIPDWQGHGVEKKELVVALKKAGLTKVAPYGLKRFLFNVSFVVAIMAYIYIGGRDWGNWTIPNEEELRLVANEVPDEDNAWIALHALTNVCTIVHDRSPDDVSFVRDYGIAFPGNGSDVQAVRSDPASPERAAKILAANEKFFEAFQAAMSRKGFFDKEKAARDRTSNDGNNAEFPTYSSLQGFQCLVRFAQLVALKAQVALENGDTGSAISDIGDIHALGQMISTNSMSFVEYLVGGLIEKLSYEKMCDAIAMGKVSDEALGRFSRMVATSETNAALCRERALKAEYAHQVNLIDWTCNTIRKVDINDVSQTLQRYVRMYKKMPDWLFRYSFRCREMRYREAAISRFMIAGEDDPVPTKCPEWPKRDFWMFVRPNMLGNILISSLMPEYGPVFKGRSWERIRPRLVIAAEKWRRAHGGENPPSLDALVPDYLAAVPRDPWSKSGEPIKYDAALGVAWSVGRDGKYGYREVTRKRAAARNDVSVDGDTQKYAFRLDGKSINNETN